MHIGIFVNHYYPSTGGAETVAKTIAEYLHKTHDITVLTRRLPNRDINQFDYNVVEYRPGDIISFNEKIKKLKFDVVVIYSDMFDFFRQLITTNNNFKLIVALCGANWIYSHRNFVNILSRNLNSVEYFICHSKLERDYKLCTTDGFSEKTIIIPNGVWTKEFDSNSLTRHDLHAKICEKRWIVNVSNFFPGKGQEHLINIISKLPNPDQLAYIQICSDIDFDIGKVLEHRWKLGVEKIKKLGVSVKLMKNIPRDHVVGFLQQSNCFVFTSEKEVAPLVLLESMACSLPWISTNVGNASDLKGGISIASIKDRRFHSVFDNRVIGMFVDGIQNLWNTPKIGEDGRLQIENDLNWDKILPNYLSLVEN